MPETDCCFGRDTPENSLIDEIIIRHCQCRFAHARSVPGYAETYPVSPHGAKNVSIYLHTAVP